MKTKMNIQNKLVFFVALVVLAMTVAPSVSAQAEFLDLEINGVDVIEHDITLPGIRAIGLTEGDTLVIEATIRAHALMEDAVFFARIRGSERIDASSGEFDMIRGSIYNKKLEIPLDIRDLDLEEDFLMIVAVEDQFGHRTSHDVRFRLQRSDDRLEILSVQGLTEVRAGSALDLDVVVKNLGRDEAEDTFVAVRIPELGLSRTTLVGDLTSEDTTSKPEKEDTGRATVSLMIPRGVTPGIYDVEIEAFSDESSTTATRRVLVTGPEADSRVISPITSKTFAADSDESYSIILANAGSTLEVYQLVADAPAGVSVEFENPVVVLSAGESESVSFNVRASEEGTYNFKVNVMSDGTLIRTEEFTARVEGNGVAFTANATILLTVILAIIFVVLLVVLIVLLTRKPEKSEEFGESYY